MKNIKTIKNVLAWALGLLSIYMIINGLIVFTNTSGVVQGSEFGMLITLANQMSLVMVWLALFSLRSLFSCVDQVVEKHEAR